jgi:hypothetical protein
MPLATTLFDIDVIVRTVGDQVLPLVLVIVHKSKFTARRIGGQVAIHYNGCWISRQA